MRRDRSTYHRTAGTLSLTLFPSSSMVPYKGWPFLNHWHRQIWHSPRANSVRADLEQCSSLLPANVSKTKLHMHIKRTFRLL